MSKYYNKQQQQTKRQTLPVMPHSIKVKDVYLKTLKKEEVSSNESN